MNGLPIGWTRAVLPQLASVNPAQPERTPADTEEVSFVPMASVEAMSGRLDASERRPWGSVRKGYKRFQDGDVLFAKITPCMENGKAALACGLHGGVGAGSTEYHVIRSFDGVAPAFVLWNVLWERTRRNARAEMTGTAGQLRVPQSFLDELEIDVPPSAEQDRIVAALESYFSRLDDAVASLERVQRNLKRYRASVLKAAVEGRLVPTEAELAKAEGRDYEPADVLVQRILKERRRRWEKAELAKMKAKGKPPKEDKWKAKYKEPVAPDTEGLPELPEGWCWANLSQLKEFSLYGPRFSSSAYSDHGQLVLRTSDISESGRVDIFAAPRIALAQGDFERFRLRVGDLLITRTGSIGTLAVFNDTVDAIAGAYLIQYRLAAPIETAWYCFLSLKSPAGQRELTGGSAGIGRPNLNAPTIEDITFGLPPIAEQGRIITEAERLLSIQDDAAESVAHDMARCARLRQSILKWAFEGKLVDQDPTDEPASILLERIRAEREAAEAKKPKRKIRRKKKATK